ncbi:MAG: helix-turn-helix domain-containing protein [Eubacterium sp.]|nr:helix-turn-helix domain-containing protein [Eubacterium sp.]
MNQVDSLQKGIDYIENNLIGEIRNENLQFVTSMNITQFQKTLLSITGYTVGEYIRNRRLTLAAFELINSNNSVLDIALKYGYDSSEGFSRAFREFHNINPGEIKKSKTNFHIFNRITLEIKVNGGSKMAFEIVELNNQDFIGFKTIAFGNMNKDIDTRWDNDDDAWESSRKEQNDLMTDDHIWYEVYKKTDDSKYAHYICSKCSSIPNGCETVHFDGGLFAKITTKKCKYPTEQLKDVYYQTLIDNEWLANSGYKLDESRNQLYITNWTMIDKEERYIEIYLPVSKTE